MEKKWKILSLLLLFIATMGGFPASLNPALTQVALFGAPRGHGMPWGKAGLTAKELCVASVPQRVDWILVVSSFPWAGDCLEVDRLCNV